MLKDSAGPAGHYTHFEGQEDATIGRSQLLVQRKRPHFDWTHTHTNKYTNTHKYTHTTVTGVQCIVGHLDLLYRVRTLTALVWRVQRFVGLDEQETVGAADRHRQVLVDLC